MCGGAILTDLKRPPAVSRRLAEGLLWPEKKKACWKGEEDDFEADFGGFEVVDEDLEFGGEEEEAGDDDVVEIKPPPVKRAFTGGTGFSSLLCPGLSSSLFFFFLSFLIICLEGRKFA